MRNFLISAGALALLAGCGEPADTPVDNRTEAVDSGQVAVPAPPPSPTPSPAPQSFAFAGDWAVNDFPCENNGVWSFARDQVVTDGHTACQVDSITDESGTGATLDMSCTAEGTASKQRWELDAAEGGKMTVARTENGTPNPPTITLQRCG